MNEESLRKSAIQRHLKGESPKSIYSSLGRSKKWYFKWLKRYQTGGSDWFKDLSRAPKQKPTQINNEERQAIIATRKRLETEPFAQFGVSAIKWELHKSGLDFPSDSTINRLLKREGLVKKNFIPV
ncbi:MAG: helix-turn-helix domain-containing protein [Thermodesulfobacteriota bacterium]|nr:helix-turn-helix domain-containing protein [Thermodesulfobacteriota bacterium]